MKIFSKFKLIAIASLLSPMSISAQVDQAQVIPFQAGTPATAADMNQNIQALIAVINSNNAEIKALRDELALVPSNAQVESIKEELALVPTKLNLPQPTLQQEMSGSVYRLGSISASLGTKESATGSDMRNKIHAAEGYLTLKSDGSMTLAIDQRERLVDTNVINGREGAITDGNGDEVKFPIFTAASFYTEDLPENDPFDGTWSLAGRTLTLGLGGDAVTFFVSVDGSTLFNNEKDLSTDFGFSMYSFNMAVGVRISKPQPNILVRIDNTGSSPDIIDAVNNGTPSHLIKGSSTNGRRIYVRNTGDADLVLGSRTVIHTQGGGMSIPPQTGTISIAPNTEISIPVTDINIPTISEQEDLAGIYLMSNDSDAPTFIVNIKSKSTSGASNP